MAIALLTTLCEVCKHLHHGAVVPTCEAFPKGIPEQILQMRADHRDPYPDDRGIQFSPTEDADLFGPLPSVRPEPDCSLVQRIAAIKPHLKALPFEDQTRLVRAMQAAGSYESLSAELQAMIRNAEVKASERNAS